MELILHLWIKPGQQKLCIKVLKLLDPEIVTSSDVRLLILQVTWLSKVSEDVVPVSYTHLDVYKRQKL